MFSLGQQQEVCKQLDSAVGETHEGSSGLTGQPQEAVGGPHSTVPYITVHPGAGPVSHPASTELQLSQVLGGTKGNREHPQSLPQRAPSLLRDTGL